MQQDYFIVIPAEGKPTDATWRFLSFSNTWKGMCFGHTKPEVMRDYTLHDYVMDFGHEIIELWDGNSVRHTTLLNHLKTIEPALSKYRHGEIKKGFVYYTDFDKCKASPYMASEEYLKAWAKGNGVVLINVQ